MMFIAISIDKTDAGYQAALREFDESELPDGDVTVRVSYSGLNYKDALAITGKAPVVRRFPMVPGIDLAGVVEHSDSPSYVPGDRVLVNGWGIGETHWGGLAQRARVSADWLVPVPDAISERQAMSIGTAGYTAMLSLMALESHGLTTDSGDVLVTGANGGVGGFAIALLARGGYSVVASTGRPVEADYLRRLGATTIVDRTELSGPGRPLGKERWAADEGGRRRRRMRERTGHGSARHCRTVHPARGELARHQQRHPAPRQARRSVEPPGRRARPGLAARYEPRGRPERGPLRCR